jgi:hypothetical protein
VRVEHSSLRLRSVQDLAQNLVLASFDYSIGMWRVTLRMIWAKYFRTWFLIDIVSIFPFDLVGLFLGAGALDQVRILRIVRVLRLVKLVRLVKASRCVLEWLAFALVSPTRPHTTNN